MRLSKVPDYFNLAAALAIPAFAHATSPPAAAPLTATAPIVTSSTLIGTPPGALIVPGIVAGGVGVPGGGGDLGPDGRSLRMVVVTFILAISVVAGIAPSSRNIAFGMLRTSTTSTVTLYPSARHFASASDAMVWATSSVSIFVVGSCADALVEHTAIATVRASSRERFIILDASLAETKREHRLTGGDRDERLTVHCLRHRTRADGTQRRPDRAQIGSDARAHCIDQMALS